MPFNYAGIDRDLAQQHVKLSLQIPPGSPFDVEFQFPPIIESDNKAANWMEKDMRQAEPFALFMGAKPREISVKWSYLVVGGPWGISKISEMVKNIRGYFYNNATTKFIVSMRLYDVVGSAAKQGSQVNFRSEGVNVSHSGPVILSGNQAYHLRTDVSMKLKHWTDLKDQGESSGDDDAPQKIEGLSGIDKIKQAAPDWY